ncbi:Hint domain-containing protein [Frigidibacter sp. MR17.14]|uniref:Hint domain-containing protein n=1 Tax=Frigidibacter sp. MR17.14 TaxID=3126509 RepID=UPI003012D171
MTQDSRARPLDRIGTGTDGGITLGSGVLTLEGELPVEYLSPGDRVITRSGARVLRAVSSRRVTSGLYRVVPHTLGGDRPEAEIRLAAGTGLLIRDWRAQALYGAPSAVVPVERLADGLAIAPVEGEATVFTLEFDGDEVVYVEGLEVACARARVEA